MKWELLNYNHEYIQKKSKEFQTDKLITKLLLNRGITDKEDVKRFLSPSVEDINNPFLFEDMEKVVERIIKARQNKEKVFIYGDYDVDGISGTAYLIIVLRNLGINIDYFIQNRVHEGPKVNKHFISYIKKRNAKLVITVDTSFGTAEEMELLTKHGIDLIITDHHRQINKVKTNINTINPKISSNYPYKHLSGSGVAYKLADAVYEKLGVNKKILYDYMDIVMIGTVADVVPMTDENRFIIKQGLANLRKTKVKGLEYLIVYLKLNGYTINTSDIGFYIAPMLNALGRIDSSKMVVDFYIEKDDFRIFNIIEEMKRANKIRRYLEINIYNEIEEKIAKMKEKPKYIFMKSKRWHSGVTGVVSSRLSLKYNIPVIIVSIKNGYGKGSCRSVEGLNIFDILKEMSHKFERFGGHDLAAGFLVTEEVLFQIEKYLKSKLYRLNKSDIEKKIMIDSYLSIESINKNIVNEINKLSPFGLDNQEPNFIDKDVTFVNFTKFGVDSRHFKGVVAKGNKRMPVIGYNLGEKINHQNFNNKFEIIYTPVVKFGKSDFYIELKIKDFK